MLLPDKQNEMNSQLTGPCYTCSEPNATHHSVSHIEHFTQSDFKAYNFKRVLET
jgi:hypothetical protein